MFNSPVLAPETVCPDAEFSAHGIAAGIAFQAHHEQTLREELQKFHRRHASWRYEHVVEARRHLAAKAASAIAGCFTARLGGRF